MIDVVLIGAFQEMIEVCEQSGVEIYGIIDNNNEGVIDNIKILGSDKDAKYILKNGGRVVISPDDPQARSDLACYYSKFNCEFVNIIHPSVSISRTAELGDGVVFHRGCNVSSNVQIGSFVRLNVNSNVMHDCKISEDVTIAPDAVVLGDVKVSRFSYIGANSVILPGINIGKNSVVGAGSVVTKDVEDGRVVAGNPAVVLR